jgi:predicted Zn-dependent protease
VPFSDTVRSAPQYAAERLMQIALPVVRRLRRYYGDGLAIILTGKDINSEARTFRFLFAQHDTANGLTVLSARRLVLSAGTTEAEANARIEQRLLKFMLRAVGEHIHRLQRTTDLSSVMYSPIMGLDDVDAMGVRLDASGQPCQAPMSGLNGDSVLAFSQSPRTD